MALAPLNKEKKTIYNLVLDLTKIPKNIGTHIDKLYLM